MLVLSFVLFFSCQLAGSLWPLQQASGSAGRDLSLNPESPKSPKPQTPEATPKLALNLKSP